MFIKKSVRTVLQKPPVSLYRLTTFSKHKVAQIHGKNRDVEIQSWAV